jgi:hypothetical protein
MNKANERRRAAMYEEKSVPAPRLVIPLPVALYSSKGSCSNSMKVANPTGVTKSSGKE